MLFQEISKTHREVGNPRREENSKRGESIQAFRTGKEEIIQKGEMRCFPQVLGGYHLLITLEI